MSPIPPQLRNILIGVLLAVVATFCLQWFQQKRKQYQTRKALKGEINSAKERLDEIVDNSDENMAIREDLDIQFSRKMYERNLSRLGLLTDEEVEHTLNYYQELEKLISSHGKYNAKREAETGDTHKRRHQQRSEETLYWMSVRLSAKNAQQARNELLPILAEKTERRRYFLFS